MWSLLLQLDSMEDLGASLVLSFSNKFVRMMKWQYAMKCSKFASSFGGSWRKD